MEDKTMEDKQDLNWLLQRLTPTQAARLIFCIVPHAKGNLDSDYLHGAVKIAQSVIDNVGLEGLLLALFDVKKEDHN
jgi:hypothetical protein